MIEIHRIARHIARAEILARSADDSRRAPIQRLIRRLLLDELVDYRRARRFPRNPGFPEPTPIFVDASGTRCAVAALLGATGEGALVARLARERTRARAAALADGPRLRAWLAATGLTLAEAAAIQPEYCIFPADYICGPYTAAPVFFLPAKTVLDTV